jgi:hypothetical protein
MFIQQDGTKSEMLSNIVINRFISYRIFIDTDELSRMEYLIAFEFFKPSRAFLSPALNSSLPER